MNELITQDGQLTPQTNNQLVLLETQIKNLTETRNQLRKLICEAMEAEGIYKVENDEVAITYIAETERETFDSKRFKKEHPNIYGLYISNSKVAPTIRVNIKEKHNG